MDRMHEEKVDSIFVNTKAYVILTYVWIFSSIYLYGCSRAYLFGGYFGIPFGVLLVFGLFAFLLRKKVPKAFCLALYGAYLICNVVQVFSTGVLEYEIFQLMKLCGLMFYGISSWTTLYDTENQPKNLRRQAFLAIFAIPLDMVIEVYGKYTCLHLEDLFECINQALSEWVLHIFLLFVMIPTSIRMNRLRFRNILKAFCIIAACAIVGICIFIYFFKPQGFYSLNILNIIVVSTIFAALLSAFILDGIIHRYLIPAWEKDRLFYSDASVVIDERRWEVQELLDLKRKDVKKKISEVNDDEEKMILNGYLGDFNEVEYFLSHDNLTLNDLKEMEEEIHEIGDQALNR